MKTNINILTYFLTNTLFLGGGLSIIFKYTNQDTYLTVILGSLLGIMFLYIIHKYINTKHLNTYLKIIYFIYLLSIIFIVLVIISSFISSYYLLKTPVIISCLPLVLLAIYNSKNLTKISYIALPLFIISLTIILFKSIVLIPDIKITNIYPILTTNIIDLFKASFIYAILSTVPSMLLLNENTNYKESLKYYILSSILILITVFILITSLGNLVNTLSYPEYSILRRVKLLKFIENIEGILAITWLFDIFITLSIASNKIKLLFNSNSNLLPSFIISIVLIIINFYVSNNYYILITIYKYHILLLSLISFINIILISLFSNKTTLFK